MGRNETCSYPCEYHRGKMEWHHPISRNGLVGIYLCEAHHSILQGRKKRYWGETAINKSLAQMKVEIKEMELEAVMKGGYNESDIDKH